MEQYKAIGVMSGSSLDGLDIANCEFYKNTDWEYSLLETTTIPYTEDWKIALRRAPAMSGKELVELDMNFGKFIGEQVNNFIANNGISASLIASHGHTVFHNPEKGFTLQTGNGQVIANTTGKTVVNNFRTKDIILGGQGAPLVPIGDTLLFNRFDYCLNLGGIANISFDKDDRRIGFDTGPANQILNYLSNQLGYEFDEGGRYAQLGKLNNELFDKLNEVSFCTDRYPKSLNNLTVKEVFLPIIEKSSASVEDKLYTTCKHIAYQINKSIKQKRSKILVTGGGARNTFLVNAIKNETGSDIIIPEEKVIDYKEALIFAFMGVLRIKGEINCLCSVTGSISDSCTGEVYIP